MLALHKITKTYYVGENRIPALAGVDIAFRAHEFVSILGPSGCGKTTLLNIIGGLDRYTDGDLIINGRSTKDFRSDDWDHYRNHSIGFIFQSYNLIPHQTVLANVELALTLSGVSKEERRARAIDALKMVGLEDQIHKKPNQMSGGQMQRVAIARALVNDPDILLADEPTGALDSATSLQIMDIIKSISKDKLVIMVTHNPELAEQYSDRIVKLLDGKVLSDSNPYDMETQAQDVANANIDLAKIVPDEKDAKKMQKTKRKKQDKNASMSFLTALSLSLNNLMTKKGRSILVSFAGSIGIIGIALILAVSNGIQGYIDRVQEDALSSYPITITQSAMDMTAMLGAASSGQLPPEQQDPNRVYPNSVMQNMIDMLTKGYTTNDLESFRAYIEANRQAFDEQATDIQYLYQTPLNLYLTNGTQVNPSPVLEQVMTSLGMGSMASGMAMQSDVFTPMIGKADFWEKQYQILHGRFPQNANEVVLIVDENNRVSDYMLYTLGLLDVSEIEKMVEANVTGKPYTPPETKNYSYEELCTLSYRVLLNSDLYQQTGSVWTEISKHELVGKLNHADTVAVVGVIRPQKDATISTTGAIGYLPSLMDALVTKVGQSALAQAQLNNPTIDIFTGLPFDPPAVHYYSMQEIETMIQMMPDGQEKLQFQQIITYLRAQGMQEEEIARILSEEMAGGDSDSTYEENLNRIGYAQLEKPMQINLYPKDFDSKEILASMITDYNNSAQEGHKITYTDMIGLMLSSVSAIVTGVSTVLICFVSISLVVSSIMIGIITYISVLERTKEIGILRAIGASKRDVSRVFNAETTIIGLTAGIFGILATLILTIPINGIIQSLTDIAATAMVSIWDVLILVTISVILTLISGLIPAKMAAKKDPVIALRSE